MRPLDEFVCQLLKKYPFEEAISPQVVAQEWIDQSGLSLLPSLGEIHHQLQRYGVRLKGAEIPDLRGHHFHYRGGDPTILYENGEWRGSVEFTLLHEFYEIILETCLLEKKETLKPSKVCAKANQFAAAVLMQEDIFRQALYQSNFDLIWLHHHFYRSYAAIAIRAVEVLNNNMAFGCVIYQRDGLAQQWEIEQVSDFKVSCAVYTSAMKNSRQFLPKKNDNLLLPAKLWNKIAEISLQNHQPVLLKRANEFSFLARPVFWFKKPAKVLLEAVKFEDSWILQAQAERLQPKIVVDSSLKDENS
jgi:Zn-dependent peptidase ImmA (M78 family)